MKHVLHVALLVSLSQVCAVSGAARAEESKASVRSAVEAALPWINEEGQWWIDEKKCASCHHSTFYVWVNELARSRGYSVDTALLKRDREWLVNEFIAAREPNPRIENDLVKEDEVKGDGNVEGIAQLLLSPASDHLDEPSRTTLLDIIRKNRLESGDWDPDGQLPTMKLPPEEVRALSSLWAGIAIGELPKSAGLKNPKTAEWFAMQLLATKTEAALKALLARQNADGSWSWTDGESGSPTATGQALFAIGRSGFSDKAEESAGKARKWLVTNQQEDGIWKTRSTKNREKSTRISNFWGTSWAVIGLLESGAPE